MVQKAKGSGKPLTKEHCQLPPGGAWAVLELPGIKPFRMAVYEKHDVVSALARGKHNWEGFSPEHYGKPGHAYDIGGNIGFYTFALAKSGWNVTAFEPMPQNVALFRTTLCENPDIANQVDLHVVGLSDVEDHCKLVSDPNNVGDGIIQCDAKETSPTVLLGRHDEVRGEFDLKVLDNEMPTSRFAKQPVDFVKIDVEGFECHVWRGASKLLKQRPRLIQSEVWKELFGCTPAEYLKLFRDANYEIKTDVLCKNNAATDGASENYFNDYWMCRAGNGESGKDHAAHSQHLAPVAALQSHAQLRTTLARSSRGTRRTVLLVPHT